MITGYAYRTRAGTFTIRLQRGRWHVVFDDENLGSYFSPQQAAEELSSGGTDWPGVTNPATLGIPDDIGDWEPIPGR